MRDLYGKMGLVSYATTFMAEKKQSWLLSLWSGCSPFY